MNRTLPGKTSIFESPLPSAVLTPTADRRRMNLPRAECESMPSYLRSTAASRLRASPINEKPLPSGFGSCGKLFPEPMSGKTFAARNAVGNDRGPIDMRTVESPVSRYIRSNNTPQIMRSIKPKASRVFGGGDEVRGQRCGSLGPSSLKRGATHRCRKLGTAPRK